MLNCRVAIAVFVATCLAATAQGESDAPQSAAAVAKLKSYLDRPATDRTPLDGEAFAATPLTRADASTALELLWTDLTDRHKAACEQELAAGKIVLGKQTMPFFVKEFGNEEPGKRSLYISMHGGGGAPKFINDSQW
jgi:hypothetical protein